MRQIPKMTTAYGMHAMAAFAQKPEPSYDVPPHAIDNILDNILASLPADGELDPETVVIYKDVPLTLADALEMVKPHLDRIRLQSIKAFEDYFTIDQTPEGLTRNFNSGDQKARRVIRHMGMFILEATNVRAELANPDLLMANAQQEHARIFPIIRAVIGPITIAHIKGPFMPPLNTKTVLEHFHDHSPAIDKFAREVASGAKPMPAGMN
ncbi:MAG: hypothetical protein AAF988_05180 [Pseudomonadota bacterium]